MLPPLPQYLSISLEISWLQEEEVDWPLWIEYITHASHLLTTVNGTVNVLIYFIKHRSTFPFLTPSQQIESRETVERTH